MIYQCEICGDFAPGHLCGGSVPLSNLPRCPKETPSVPRRRALSGLHQPTPERLREVRAMEAFIDAIWFKVLCSAATFEQAQDAIVAAWGKLDKDLGVWYWSCQPGALRPQHPEAAKAATQFGSSPSPPKEG